MITKEASTKQALDFLDTVSGRPDLLKQLTAAPDWPASQRIASDAGFDLSGLNENEARALLIERGHDRPRELSVEDLASVAGGAKASDPNEPVVIPIVPISW